MLIDNNASDTFTVIEVNGRDRPGFLHIVTRALTRLNLQIASAHITTYGERAVDVFYVKDLFGLKVVNADKLKQVAAEVEKSIRDFDARFEPAGAMPKRKSISPAATRPTGCRCDRRRPPGRAGAARRTRAQAAGHRAPHRQSPLGDRSDDLHPRHARPVRSADRRHGDQGANIVDAKIFTLANGMRSTFWIGPRG